MTQVDDTARAVGTDVATPAAGMDVALAEVAGTVAAGTVAAGTVAAGTVAADDVARAAGGGGWTLDREFTVRARTQRELVARRFLRHRPAMAALAVFAVVVVLAFSSIGVAGLPGWWGRSYTATETVAGGGRMTLDLLPAAVDGDGFAIGEHPFGQDDVGRDYFALTMRGAQRSLTIALLVGLLSTVLGVVVGGLAGFFTGPLDTLLMRLTDMVITVPSLVVAAVLGRYCGGGPIALAVLLSLISWPQLARLVRGEFLSLREKEFVEAARAMGAGPGRIIVRHLLPNAAGTIIVNASLTISAAILLETALSFVGLGVASPDTSLGKLINDYQDAFQVRPWLFWWPGVFIVVIALCVNFVGDGLRDAFDPKQNRVRA